jgi:hypothetical protein
VVAAKLALSQTCLSRIVLPAGNFVVSPLLILPLEKVLLSRHPRLRLPVYFGVTISVFWTWLVLSLSLYPQLGELESNELEPSLLASTTARSVFYNKGL